MKLVFPEISSPIEFCEGVINCLVIENQELFYSVVEDTYKQINGEEGFCVLSDKNVLIDFSKYAELITSFIPFEINRRTLLSKIAAKLEKTALDETHYMELQRILGDIERFINDIAFEFPCGIECSKLTAQGLIKMAGVHICEDEGSTLNKILDYMELVREFEKDKLFIFVNMRGYFSDEEMESFAETVIAHKYKVLLLESREYNKLGKEKRRIIDEDFCEI